MPRLYKNSLKLSEAQDRSPIPSHAIQRIRMGLCNTICMRALLHMNSRIIAHNLKNRQKAAPWT